MSLNPSTPDDAAARAWRTFWIASAAVFLVLLDTTAVVAAYAPPRTHFSAVSAADLSWNCERSNPTTLRIHHPPLWAVAPDRAYEPTSCIEGQLQTGCSRSRFAGEWQRSPIPDVRWSHSRETG